MKVRNEQLYNFLLRQFRRVIVNRRGDPFSYRVMDRDGRRTIERISGGEVYVVNCPLCQDKRARLNISHVFGMYIENVHMNYVAHCWNCEGPVSQWLMTQYQLFEEYGGQGLTAEVFRQDGPIRLSEVADDCARDMLKLRGVQRLDRIPADSAALGYLINRGYDPYRLASTYAVSYCGSSSYETRMGNKRLIIPIFYEGRYVGWRHGRLQDIRH